MVTRARIGRGRCRRGVGRSERRRPGLSPSYYMGVLPDLMAIWPVSGSTPRRRQPGRPARPGHHRRPGGAPGGLPLHVGPVARRIRGAAALPPLAVPVGGRQRHRLHQPRPAALLRLGPHRRWRVGEAGSGAPRTLLPRHHARDLRPPVARRGRPDPRRHGRRSSACCGLPADSGGCRMMSEQVRRPFPSRRPSSPS